MTVYNTSATDRFLGTIHDWSEFLPAHGFLSRRYVTYMLLKATYLSMKLNAHHDNDGSSVKKKINLNLFSLPFIVERKYI